LCRIRWRWPALVEAALFFGTGLARENLPSFLAPSTTFRSRKTKSMIEPKSTLNTGNVRNDRTVEVLERI
jgi:hypothetical protein